MSLCLQNLTTEVQQHLLTIQQLTEQVQALTSLKRSRPTAELEPQSPEQQSPSVQDSAAVSEATDIDMDVDTSPGLESKGSGFRVAMSSISAVEGGGENSPSSKIGAVGKTSPTIHTVGFDDDEVSIKLIFFRQNCLTVAVVMITGCSL